MNYIYDILLNFKPVLYDFYEWNKEDEITHIRKIPIIKVESNILYDIKNYKIKISNTFLEKYRNKTEKFTKKGVESIEYALVFTDGKEEIVILFKKNETYKVSKMLIDEAEDLIDISKRFEKITLNYEKKKKLERNEYTTRKEYEEKKYSLKMLQRVKEESQLEYLYLECFNKNPNKNIDIQKELEKKIKQNNNEIGKKIYQIFKLVSTKK